MSDHCPARRRRWPIAAAIGVLIAAGATTFLALDRGSTKASSKSTRAASTVAVRRQTLTEQQSMTGTVGFGPAKPLNNKLSGTYTTLPAVGAVVGNGQQLYRVDDTPVVDLRGAIPAYRAIAEKMAGRDIGQLNSSLRALGFLHDNPGNTFDWTTRWAVEAWQKSLGLHQTGVVELGRVVFTPAPIRIATVTPAVGDSATPGAAVLTTTGTVAQVTISTNVANRAYFKIGQTLAITYPDDSSTTARLTSIGPVVTPTSDSNSGPTVNAQAALHDPKRAAAFQAATVDVVLKTSQRPNVLTVPVTALLALHEGGYAVAVDDSTGRHLIGVTIGLIVSDTVEVSAPSLRAGMKVEVPAA